MLATVTRLTSETLENSRSLYVPYWHIPEFRLPWSIVTWRVEYEPENTRFHKPERRPRMDRI